MNLFVWMLLHRIAMVIGYEAACTAYEDECAGLEPADVEVGRRRVWERREWILEVWMARGSSGPVWWFEV